MFLFLSWPTGRARFPALPQKPDDIGSCTLTVCSNQAPRLLAHDPKHSERNFLPMLFPKCILSVNFYLHLKHQQLSNKGTLTGARRTLSLDTVLFHPQPHASIFLHWESSLAALPNSFPPVIWSQDPDLNWLENRKKLRLQCWCHATSCLGQTDAHCVLLTSSPLWICSTLSIPATISFPCGIEMLICASPKPLGSHRNSGVLLGSSWNIVFLGHELCVDLLQLLGLLSWIWISIRKVYSPVKWSLRKGMAVNIPSSPPSSSLWLPRKFGCIPFQDANRTLLTELCSHVTTCRLLPAMMSIEFKTYTAAEEFEMQQGKCFIFQIPHASLFLSIYFYLSLCLWGLWEFCLDFHYNTAKTFSVNIHWNKF